MEPSIRGMVSRQKCCISGKKTSSLGLGPIRSARPQSFVKRGQRPGIDAISGSLFSDGHDKECK